jgi:hypothetical protein
MLVLIAMGWLFIGDADCVFVRRGFMCAGLFGGWALMLAKAGLLCRGDMLTSDVKRSDGVWSDRVVGRQSAELSICGELIADWRILPFCCSMLVVQLSLWSGLLTSLSSLLRRPGLAVLSSFKRLASVGDIRCGDYSYRRSKDLLLGSCLALKSSR